MRSKEENAIEKKKKQKKGEEEIAKIVKYIMAVVS